MSPRRAVTCAAILFLALLYPPLHAFHTWGTKAIFDFLAPDSFYYLTIARNASAGLPTSFDGATVTNGFHPLWQYLLIPLLELAGRDQERQLAAAFLASCGLVTVGVALAGAAVARATGSILAALWLVPGPFTLLFRAEGLRQYGLTYTYTPWAFMNGMESGLSLAFGGALLWVLLERPLRARRALAAGLLLALCVLARLDDVFLPASFGIVALLLPGEPRGRRALAARLALPSAAALLLYGGFELAMGQALLPTSGRLKSGFALLENARLLIHTALPPLATPIVQHPGMWFDRAQRLVALLFPALLAALGLGAAALRSRASARSPRDVLAAEPIACALALYLIAKGAFNASFVALQDQGYWYHALPLLFANALAVVFVARALATSRVRIPRALVFAAWLAVYLYSAANALYGASGETSYHRFWEARHEIASALRSIDPQIRLVDNTDGLVAYTLGIPALPATALAADPAGVAAFESSRRAYWEYCLSRGHDTLASVPPLRYLPTPRRGFASEVVYLHGPTGAVFHRVRKVAAGADGGEGPGRNAGGSPQPSPGPGLERLSPRRRPRSSRRPRGCSWPSSRRHPACFHSRTARLAGRPCRRSCPRAAGAGA